ncbi:hypothetical protein [Paractinoplanes durhamensis]|uniref:hypothetical protein n=1 Tax=Paractinoplanes durhamensis TaxID=113563 RepID=UPI003631EF3A
MAERVPLAQLHAVALGDGDLVRAFEALGHDLDVRVLAAGGDDLVEAGQIAVEQVELDERGEAEQHLVPGSPDEVVERDPIAVAGQRGDPGDHLVVHLHGLEDLEDDLLRPERQGDVADQELAGQVDEAEPIPGHFADTELGERVHHHRAGRVCVLPAGRDGIHAAAEQQLVGDHVALHVEDRLASHVHQLGAVRNCRGFHTACYRSPGRGSDQNVHCRKKTRLPWKVRSIPRKTATTSCALRHSDPMVTSPPHARPVWIHAPLEKEPSHVLGEIPADRRAGGRPEPGGRRGRHRARHR